MTIDWDQPICLDTVPPREARVVRGPDDDGDYKVHADWFGNGGSKFSDWCCPDGSPFDSDLPRVRNLTPAELAARDDLAIAPDGAKPAASFDGAPDDIAAELAAFVGRIAGMSDTECDFADMAGMAGFEDGFALRDAARAALAKWEARK